METNFKRNIIETRRKKKNKKIILFLIVISLAYLGYRFFFYAEKTPAQEKNSIEEILTDKSKTPAENWKKTETYTVTEGDLPADVFSQYGKLDANDTEALLAAAKDIYDFSKIKIGQKLIFYFNEEVRAKKIKYEIDKESMIIAERESNNFKVSKEKIPYISQEETVSSKIDEFLYKDALDAGLSEATILEIADIFSFDIDFTTDIREGDEFKIVYEKRTLNSEKAPDGKVLAAKFINAGQEYFAYYFADGEDGSYYDSEGRELLKQFLRAPLSYRRITSGFTGARFHPITKTVTAHYQIDYAAPIGTPVVATARGAVVSAGWEGGWGNMIRLKHDNGYTTHYGHLSAFAKGVRSGASVSQGQVIGYVGSTGWSTGPHLDYGMKLNGSPINPLSLKLPKGNILPGEKMESFQKVKEKYDAILK